MTRAIPGLRDSLQKNVSTLTEMMWPFDTKEVSYTADTDGGKITVMVTKGRNDRIDALTAVYKGREAGRYDGFSVSRDLAWTIAQFLRDLGL